jgi:hypothetical protein
VSEDNVYVYVENLLNESQEITVKLGDETQKKYAAELQKEGYHDIEIPARGQEYQIL